MDKIIDMIFQNYNYLKAWESDSNLLKFYTNSNNKLVSYFLVNFIDCQGIEDNEKTLKDKLMELEKNYVKFNNSEKGLKDILQGLFQNSQEASQLDKNTSAIYLLKFNDLGKLDHLRNLIYSIEESPNYFRRYILPYTEKQAGELLTIINDYKSKNCVEILSDLANNEDEYYNLLEHKNLNRVYELVIRLFSKIPFLQYTFKAEPMPISLDTSIEMQLADELIKYHDVLEKQDTDLEQLLELEASNIMSDEDLENEIEKLIRGDA